MLIIGADHRCRMDDEILIGESINDASPGALASTFSCDPCFKLSTTRTLLLLAR
jgi:hypothetical protein